MPCVTPGTPSGNTGSRTPGNFFLVLRNERSVTLSMMLSMPSAQPASTMPRQSRTAVEIRRDKRIGGLLSALTLGGHERRQELDLRSYAVGRFRVGQDRIEPVLSRSAVARMPGGERQNLARGVAERTTRRSKRFEPPVYLAVGRVVDENEPGPHSCEIAQWLVERRISGERVVGGNGRLAVLLALFGSGAEARERAVARAAGLGDVVESGLRLRVLSLAREFNRRLESRADLGGLVVFPPIVTAPSGNADNDQHESGEDVSAIPLPQLLELFPSDFLVDFPEDIRHEILQPRRRSGRPFPPLGTASPSARKINMWQGQGKGPYSTYIRA